jgi:hypothetical protein
LARMDTLGRGSMSSSSSSLPSMVPLLPTTMQPCGK